MYGVFVYCAFTVELLTLVTATAEMCQFFVQVFFVSL